MRHTLLITLLILLAPLLLAQQDNLVYNPSFEDYLSCPRRIEATGQLTIVEGWYQPTGGSADYFNRCGTPTCSVPRNKMGYQQPHSGNGYCGIYCNKTEYREYLQTELRQPLAAGCTYRLTFYVSLSEYSTCAVATMGGLLTAYRAEDTARCMLTHREEREIGAGMRQVISTTFIPQVQNSIDTPLTDWRRWTRISGTFTAKGGERFLTIGNFATATKSGITVPDSLKPQLTGAYYFIDDVELVLINCPPDKPKTAPAADDPLFDPAKLTTGSTIVLRNIFFDFDKSTLLQKSFNELQKLIALLEAHPHMKIMVVGHTDNQGSNAYNQRLSEQRANAVVEYLVMKGIDGRRLKSKGRGAYEPIDVNTTEQGRANNRRVEVKILNM